MAANPITRATIIKTFLALFVLTVLLRFFYSSYLFEDDGLWLAAAEELLRGKRLYSEIYFDKPPALPLLYAALFHLFGAHILVIRLFTIAYSFAISALLYCMGARLYNARMGLLAAALFTIFSTTYSAGHLQGLNTDFLMVLPYTASAYFFIRAQSASERSSFSIFLGGLLAGLSFQINPKGAFALLYFAALLLLLHVKPKGSAPPASEPAASLRLPFFATFLLRRLTLFAIAVAGFVIASLPFVVAILATHSGQAYWAYVWAWGSRYAGYIPLTTGASNVLRITGSYLALNNTLLIALIVSIWQASKQNRRAEPVSEASGAAEQRWLQTDRAVLLWLAISYIGVVLGGRLYSHYFFQTLPALCLIGTRGLGQLTPTRQSGVTLPKLLRIPAAVLLIIGFGFTIVRFHSRTVALATDWLRGKPSAKTQEWYQEQLNREEQIVASFVCDKREVTGNAPRAIGEALRNERRNRQGQPSSADYLFVWGYRPEIYYWSGLLPASRYLSSQPLTGVPADVHFFGWDYHSILDETAAAAARAQLLKDLEASPPRYIVDELAIFNSRLAMRSFPELKEFLRRYKRVGKVERFFIYRQKNWEKKLLKRQQKRERKAQQQPTAPR